MGGRDHEMTGSSFGELMIKTYEQISTHAIMRIFARITFQKNICVASLLKLPIWIHYVSIRELDLFVVFPPHQFKSKMAMVTFIKCYLPDHTRQLIIYICHAAFCLYYEY